MKAKRKTNWLLVGALVIAGASAVCVLNRLPIWADHRRKVALAQAQIADLGSAVEAYRYDCKRLPAEQFGILALLCHDPGVTGWSGPYYPTNPRRVPHDPWGGRFQYSTNGATFVIRSAGPDKELGTPDDITS